MSNVIQILSGHLRSIGADGLVCPHADCACKLGALAPCGNYFGACQPGYLSTAQRHQGKDWLMYAKRPQVAVSAPKPSERCQHCIDRQDGFYGSWAPDCPIHDENSKPRAAAQEGE